MTMEVTSRLQRLEVGLMLGDGRCRFGVVSGWTTIQAARRRLDGIITALLTPVDSQSLEIDWEIEIRPASEEGKWRYQAWLSRKVWQPLVPSLGATIREFLMPLCLGREREELTNLGTLSQIEEELRSGSMSSGSRTLFLSFDDRRGHHDYTGRIWTNDGRGDLISISAGSTVRCLNGLEQGLAKVRE